MLLAIVKTETNGMIGTPSLSARAVKGGTEEELDAAIAEYQDFLVGCDQRSLDDTLTKYAAMGHPYSGPTHTDSTRDSYPVLWRGSADEVPERYKVYVW